MAGSTTANGALLPPADVHARAAQQVLQLAIPDTHDFTLNFQQ